jgi:hypothetical protein
MKNLRGLPNGEVRLCGVRITHTCTRAELVDSTLTSGYTKLLGIKFNVPRDFAKNIAFGTFVFSRSVYIFPHVNDYTEYTPQFSVYTCVK